MSKINFKDKHIRYGGYGALLTLVVIAITIVLNIVVTNLNLKIDTTSEKIYSLTDTTKEVTKDIKDPINLYVLEETGKETSWLQEILMKYTKLNNNINVIYKDPILYPTFGNDYLKRSNQNLSSIMPSSIIVENQTSGKFKIVPPTEFVQSTGTDSGNGITVESAITNAIGYVLNDKDGMLYYTTGHQETELSSCFTDACERVNLSTSPLNLLTDEMPDPANSSLIIYSPHSDFTKEEVDKVIDYMTAGGKAMIFMDIDASPSDLPTFSGLLDYYGVAHQQGMAVETNSNNMASMYPTFLIPNKGDHTVLSNMSSNSSLIVLPNASGFEAVTNARTSLRITPLLTTSDDAFLRTDLNNSSSTKQSGDLDGPIALAYAIEDTETGIKDASGETDHTKMIVIGNTYGFSDKYVQVSATGNESFISSCLGWLLSVDTNYAIEAKTEDTYALRTISSTTALLIEALIVIVIPLIVIVLGIIVCIRRRHA